MTCCHGCGFAHDATFAGCAAHGDPRVLGFACGPDLAAEALNPVADMDDAMSRATRWMHAGETPHPFVGSGRYCRLCGCGDPGWQHHGQPNPRQSPARS